MLGFLLGRIFEAFSWVLPAVLAGWCMNTFHDEWRSWKRRSEDLEVAQKAGVLPPLGEREALARLRVLLMARVAAAAAAALWYAWTLGPTALRLFGLLGADPCATSS